jgi:predicted nicotinamide N-methyase
LWNSSQGSKPLKVVELGSGCGVVGIGLAQLVPNCDVLLTDLPEAQEILNRNASASHLATSSRISTCVLDWESDTPAAVTKRDHDIILVADCTYNADTIPALVSTLSNLHSASPKAVILLATKRRHSSEAIFFQIMNDACFTTIELCSIRLPNLSPSFDGDFEKVEIYLFRKD